jgi:hypothetical protein
MKPRRDCTCPCHRSGVAIHVVPCCEGMLLGLASEAMESRKKTKTVQEKTFPPLAPGLGPGKRIYRNLGTGRVERTP